MQGFLITLLICSVTISISAALYMAVTPLLAKRYSATGRYYAWLIFVTGLIIPFRPHLGNAIVKVTMPGPMTAPIIRTGNGALAAAFVTGENAFVLPDISWWQIAAVIWMAGGILFLAYHIIGHYRFLKMVSRWSENVIDEQVITLFESLKMQMGLSKRIGLQICDSIGSPMLIGFANPRILLPGADFAEEELRLILKHELVHYKRKDLWYKVLVLIATAIHWFNPIVRLMAKAIGIQCELSCDAEVVRSTGADMRQYYSETIIGVIRHQSKLKTVLSTNFYGGKKGMKTRIFSIMDMSNKKAGIAVLCGVLMLTLGTGVAFAANAESKKSKTAQDNFIAVSPWIAVDGFVPSPDIYAPYAAFGITISEDGRRLLYEGQPVRQFVDEKADGWAFYLDESGNGNLSAVRNGVGEVTGIESITTQKARAYYEDFFAEELHSDFPAEAHEEVQTLAEDMVGENKFAEYQQFGITCSEADRILSFYGKRVKFFIDQTAGASPDLLWTDDAGTVNLAAIRDASGQITGIESISEEEVREYQDMVDEYERNSLAGVEERIEAKMKESYPED